MKRYQIVFYFPKWVGLGFRRLDIERTNMAYIYEWYLLLGWCVVRKWVPMDKARAMFETRSKVR